MRSIRLTLSVLVVCTALTACGGGDGVGAPDPTGAPSPVTGPPTASPSASPDPGDASTAPPPPTRPKRPGGGPTLPPPAGDTTLTGTVTSGVEPGCLLLDGYLLLGGPRDVLASGARVTVSGRAQPDTVTTCQEGIPFMVESARRS
ncbi:hypothetical protein [Micromonospora sp. CPCC 205556]|uniref:hypothetical protein n=1 Tax=Micromonospora sp. CPCC 205556 TaxID=3122398 RepID=UPI002FF33D42